MALSTWEPLRPGRIPPDRSPRPARPGQRCGESRHLPRQPRRIRRDEIEQLPRQHGTDALSFLRRDPLQRHDLHPVRHKLSPRRTIPSSWSARQECPGSARRRVASAQTGVSARRSRALRRRPHSCQARGNRPGRRRARPRRAETPVGGRRLPRNLGNRCATAERNGAASPLRCKGASSDQPLNNTFSMGRAWVRGREISGKP